MSLIAESDSAWGLFTGLSTLTLGAVGFVWRLVVKLEKLSTTIEWEKIELSAIKTVHESVSSKLSERLTELHDQHSRLRELAASMPTRADLRDMEARLNERIETLSTRVDLVCNR
jgi:ubiquinone biosynthesis protein UbiJ